MNYKFRTYAIYNIIDGLMCASVVVLKKVLGIDDFIHFVNLNEGQNPIYMHTKSNIPVALTFHPNHSITF